MRKPSDPELWNRIQAYDLDSPSVSLPFSARLARENGWTLEFSRQAIEEYKKFIYLICVSNETLTPSQEVDEVWHLHLVYTRGYWDDFCAATLGREIHHTPTEGGAAEDAGFRYAYQRTKERYVEEFDTEPPSDIWPTPELRFSEATQNGSASSTIFGIDIPLIIAGLLLLLALALVVSSEGGQSSVAMVFSLFAVVIIAGEYLSPSKGLRKKKPTAIAAVVAAAAAAVVVEDAEAIEATRTFAS